MYRRVCASVLIAAVCLPAGSALAQTLPPIKITSSNTVPECVTPGRLTAFLKDRNSRLDPDHAKIAVEYMRHGEALGIRWDYAFFQMVVETGYLTFERSKGKRGDVRNAQNNFAGLGATGRGASGESFPDVSTGVLAHLQHVLMYSGAPVEAPVAERTRKVIEWRVLDDWRDGLKRPMTYGDLAQKWANNKSYADAIATHAGIFDQRYCNTPDPAPELLAEARPHRAEPAPLAVAEVKQPAVSEPESRPAVSPGRELAQRAIDEARAHGDNRRSSLGGSGLGALADRGEPSAQSEAPAAAAPERDTTALGSPLMQAASAVGSILRSMAQPPPAVHEDAPPAATHAMMPPPAAQAKVSPPVTQVKIAPTKIIPQMPAPEAKLKCRVWTASYGGNKAMLIKASTAEGVSYTVLDVNEGAEKREAAAYIAAYAKGGNIESTFGSQTQALEKAFELCPEG